MKILGNGFLQSKLEALHFYREICVNAFLQLKSLYFFTENPCKYILEFQSEAAFLQ